MKLTKAMVREAWARQPGLGWTGRLGPDGMYCASQAIRAKTESIIGSDLWTLFICGNDAFRSEDGVTPEERRDCMIAMLDSGAFDAWLG